MALTAKTPANDENRLKQLARAIEDGHRDFVQAAVNVAYAGFTTACYFDTAGKEWTPEATVTSTELAA